MVAVLKLKPMVRSETWFTQNASLSEATGTMAAFNWAVVVMVAQVVNVWTIGLKDTGSNRLKNIFLNKFGSQIFVTEPQI